MNKAILVINSGSSSIKFAIFETASNLHCVWRGYLQAIGSPHASMQARNDSGEQLSWDISGAEYDVALKTLLEWAARISSQTRLLAVGHRIVHGGIKYSAPVQINDEILADLKTLNPLAPLHQPHNLLGVEIISRIMPELPQIACFDTAFHHLMPKLEQVFALSQKVTNAGVRRYGFHGLSYEYIADILPQYLEGLANGKVIVAHLGNGASLCALEGRKSIATTMSFSPLDGIPMATRSGSIDPVVVLYLQKYMGMTIEEVSELLYDKSGLYGVSGISGDIRELLTSSDVNAKFALELFVYNIIKAIGALSAALGGVDAMVFTGGIGENAAIIRENICKGCVWLGMALDNKANNARHSCISRPESKISTWIIPTNEELMIARHTFNLLA